MEGVAINGVLLYYDYEPAAGQRIREVSLIVRSVRSEGYTVDSTKQIVSVRTILFKRMTERCLVFLNQRVDVIV